MNTMLNGVAGSVSIHSVAAIQASANSSVTEEGKTIYWQTLTFTNAEDKQLGEVTLFFENPEAALPIGDQPPYWGIDPSKVLAMVDGQPPF